MTVHADRHAEFERLELRRTGSVVEVVLCRPDLVNRFDELLHNELAAAFATLAEDSSVLAVVLSSTGRYFSAGGDTDTMVRASGELAYRFTMIDRGRQLFRTVADFPKPLIVALHGDVYGLGASIILLADAIVVAPEVKIADTHVQMGLVAGDGGCVAWPMNVSMVRAKRHLLTGDPIAGALAYQLGLVSDLVETPDEVAPRALEIARQIAKLPPVAVQLTKRALNKQVSARAEDVLDLAFYLEALTFGTDDLQEAIRAFKDKRPGNWTGR